MGLATSHTPEVHKWNIYIGVVQFKALDLGQEISELVSIPVFHHVNHLGKLSSTAPSNSSNAAQLSHSHVHREASPITL